MAVSLSVANERASLPVAYRLYVPKEWAEDPARRAKAGVPEEIRFQTKPQIALEVIGRALAHGMPRAWCWPMPATEPTWTSRRGCRGWAFPMSSASSHTLRCGHRERGPWPPSRGAAGRPPKLRRRDGEHGPIGAKELALALPATAWQTWLGGTEPRAS